jgi:hypothetical protein
MHLRRGFLSRSAFAIATALLTIACGAKTGLRLPDVEHIPDVPDVIERPEACVPGTFPFLRRSAEVMFVVDRSSSMNLTLDGRVVPPGDPNTRWRVLRNALSSALPPYQSQLLMGAVFFPQPINDGNNDLMAACTGSSAVDLRPANNQAQPIIQIFDTTSPGGGTPTLGAIALAADFLQSNALRGHGRYIVLATDGGPNCNFTLDPRTCICTSRDPMTNQPNCASEMLAFNCLDYQNTDRAIMQSYQAGIPVYVIGIPDPTRTDLTDALNRMALLGGRPRAQTQPTDPLFYSVQRPSDLNDAFGQIQRTIVQCAFVTPGNPDDPDGITVLLNGAPISRDPSRADGWEWTDRANGEITLFGTACDAVVNNPGAVLTGRVGCADGG